MDKKENLKAQYRQTFKQNLQTIQNKPNTYALDFKLHNMLKEHLDFYLKTQKINQKISLLFYYPLPLEFNCKKLLQFYKKKKNIQIFLPLMCGVSFKIVKYRLPLQKKTFGVFEPSNSSFRNFKLNCAIVPVIGIDNTFRRIGFGKGMYDRFFSTLKTQPNIIFICRALNLAHQNITQDYDLQANICFTPLNRLEYKEKYGNLANNKLRTIRTYRWRR